MYKPIRRSSFRGRTPGRGGSGGGSRGGRGNIRYVSANVLRDFIQRSLERVSSTEKEVEVFVPKNNFTDFKINPRLLSNIKSKKFVAPTPIQDQVIPLVLEGKDVVGIANTGTGKSAAFLIPIIENLTKNRGAKALIIVPTRELAVQLYDDLESLCWGMDVRGVGCVGGMSIFNQVKGLRNFHNVVIGTPGRLKDLYERRSLILSGYTTIVLDEVDRMLDMGFIRDIEFLLDKLPKTRQSLFFSATINRDVEVVMTRFVKEYVKVSVKTRDNKDNISQSIVEVSSPTQKLDKLKELIKTENMERAIVFVRTKRGADKLDETLYADGHKVAAIHGDKRQSQRLKILDAFKAGKLKILIATDVVARGIDVHDVTHIINYDLPESLDDYIHRIGRTGRADKKGIALTFIESGYSRY